MLLRAAVFAHRWLGIGGCLLFIAWFASGIVMMYARMPELSRAERAALSAPLDFSAAALAPADAARRYALTPSRVRLGMLEGRPVYRMVDAARSVVIFADTGERFRGFTADRALAEARRALPQAAPTLRYDAHLSDPDQWTLQARALLPVHRIALGDGLGTTVYLSDVSGEVAHATTARQRRIAYCGAVLHWLYFTPLRIHSAVWNRTIVWLSAAGSVMCFLGLVWGISVGLKTPYRGWMRWHHYSGLVFGVVSLTWVFSGLLSMDPVPWLAGNTPSRADRDVFSGGPLRLEQVTLDMVRQASQSSAPTARPARDAASGGVKDIEITQFRGVVRMVVDDRPAAPIERAALLAAARDTVPGARIQDATLLDDHDAYYYDRSGELPLPVLRVRFADRANTWLYLDPGRGTIVRKEVRSSRVNRWLYHGLHSLDFPWLYDRRPLWDIVVIVLSLGGIASAITAIAPAWRRLRRHAHRLYT